MLRNENIICISSIDWDFLLQRHQIFMSEFARQGNKVIYIENLNPSMRLNWNILLKIIKRLARILVKIKNIKRDPNITVITPLIIPLKNRLADFINKKILIKLLAGNIRSKGIKNPVVWTYLATSTSLELIDELKPKTLIYDCVFDALIHPNSPKDIAASEKKLIRSADIIFTDNHYLYNKCKGINPKTYIINPGVDFDLFAADKAIKNQKFLSGAKKPIICFFGGIDEIRIDLELVRYIAENKPDWSIVLFGPVIKTSIKRLKLPNIIFKGTVRHEELAGYLRETDVLILPYKIIPFSRSIFPAKIFECFATGKPIVATPLEELSLFKDIIKIASSNEDFLKGIEDSIVLNDPKKRDARL
ncbi:glycosyltransferase family 1 protein, partial [bacterium]